MNNALKFYVTVKILLTKNRVKAYKSVLHFGEYIMEPKNQMAAFPLENTALKKKLKLG